LVEITGETSVLFVDRTEVFWESFEARAEVLKIPHFQRKDVATCCDIVRVPLESLLQHRAPGCFRLLLVARHLDSALGARQRNAPHLAERIRAEQAALEARSGTDGERKTITALFADLKGSTALIEGLDPEEARSIIDPALQLMMDAVHRYQGYVAQVLGDGIFALFGAPIAHEDHPQRALHAARRMQEDLKRYADRLRERGQPPLSVRVGVNSGEVVV
jgi:class 3 adenylate cyclase